jgi:polynucleotide 5'-hydroxyl-kinase GRC3/NOL9
MDPLIIPPAWEEIDPEPLAGVLMLIGAPDTGKSTFARFLFQRLAAAGRRPAYLDGDPGQSSLGPPGAITAALAAGKAFPPAGPWYRWFVGAVSPVRHMLPLLAGVSRLTDAMSRAGSGAVIYDTTGLVQPQRGGCTLKWTKIDLLRPAAVFAFQRTNELEPLLAPLRRRRLRLVELSPAPAVRRRDLSRRQEHRAGMFRAYFTAARELSLDWQGLAVYPSTAALEPRRLVALEDEGGLVRELGIVVRNERRNRRIVLLTPAADAAGVETLRVGDLLVDPETFRDRPVGS